MVHLAPQHGALREECPECATPIGEVHMEGCDVSRCLVTGRQELSCHGLDHNHDEDNVDRWTGLWPGDAECIAWGWYAKFEPGLGWRPTTADDPQGAPDLNRLAVCKWDPGKRAHIRPTVKVHLEGAYVDGHEYERDIELPEPGLPDEDFWNEVFDHTGDAHFGPSGESIDSYEEATVIGGRFDGESYSWGG